MGYGAFLLDPLHRERVLQIVTAMAAALTVPLTCKIRLLPTTAETVTFAKELEAVQAVRFWQCTAVSEEHGQAQAWAGRPGSSESCEAGCKDTCGLEWEHPELQGRCQEPGAV
eukprot:CAMPEP_0175131890 /NCGR_PEP_ID=MMETSP0087-20121206/6784_1 /TAXON_ID=136419 /ORGANISM="Unknown Unknown, Strain D1" /LENGTH=112 /DNA_ID=CAMNT_0016414211 /DNA_START=185 /DNA_END=524 /DNA_ORIENTATION=+